MTKTAFARPAFVLRPNPSTRTTGQEPVQFGGKPRMPLSLEWPDSTYFIAQIDFARLPKSISLADRPFALPDMPERGSAYIFLPLSPDGMYESRAIVHFTTEDTAELPEREPPIDLMSLHEIGSPHVRNDGLSADGKVLVKKAVEALPFLSLPTENPLLNSPDQPDLGDDAYVSQTDLETASLDAVLRTNALPPFFPVVENPLTQSEIEQFNAQFPKPHESRYHLDPDVPLTWHFVFRWAKVFLSQVMADSLQSMKTANRFALDRHEQRLKMFNEKLDALGRLTHEQRQEWLALNGEPKTPERDLPNLPAAMVALTERKSIHDADVYAPTTGAETALDLSGLPQLHAPLDRQVQAWFDHAKRASGALPRAAALAFLALFKNIYAGYSIEMKSRTPASVEMLDRVYGSAQVMIMPRVRAESTKYFAQSSITEAKAAFDEDLRAAVNTLSQTQLWDKYAIEETAPKDPDPRFVFTMGEIVPQMFGFGFTVQREAQDRRGEVLLFQLGDSFGLPISLRGDGVLQLWIMPEELAEGEFDHVETTVEFS